MAKYLLPILFLNHAFAHSTSDSTHLDLFRVGREPHIWFGLMAMSLMYYLGLRNLKTRSAIKPAHKLQPKFFIFGMIALFVALISSIDAYSESLASIHMLQHTLILMVAAPLMAVAGMDYYFIQGLYPLVKKTNLRVPFKHILKLTRFSRPLWIWSLYAFTLYIWHIPILYKSALANPLIHDFQHLGFFASAYLFWRLTLNPYGERLPYAPSVIYLFISMLHAMVLGALMGLSPRVWYDPYIQSSHALNINPLSDQQIAGLIMWMPAGSSFILVSIYSVYKLINHSSMLSK